MANKNTHKALTQKVLRAAGFVDELIRRRNTDEDYVRFYAHAAAEINICALELTISPRKWGIPAKDRSMLVDELLRASTLVLIAGAEGGLMSGEYLKGAAEHMDNAYFKLASTEA